MNAGGNATRNVLFESVTGEVMIQNQCNWNVCGIHYDVIARKTLNSQTNVDWGHGHPMSLGVQHTFSNSSGGGPGVKSDSL